MLPGRAKMLLAGLVAAAAASLASALPQQQQQHQPVERRATTSSTTEMRDGVQHTLVSDAGLGLSMDYVTDSGICETTAGVRQYSGYLSPAPGLNYFFWFFEARNSPDTAPLAAWFNGGPGCSSLIGLFQENGPCNFPNNQSDPALNPYSFNKYANMLYIDQPIGAGFSYGVDPTVSTVTAAPFVWSVLQLFYKQFPQYASREFGIFTESYGGHYGPEFADYIADQNVLVSKGLLPGAEPIDLVALGINNGWYDGIAQYKAYIDYALHNKYNQIISQNQTDGYYQQYHNVCRPALETCTSTSDPAESANCAAAVVACLETIEDPILGDKDFDPYDVREPSNDPYPPTAYLAYLNRADVQKAIGAKVGTDFEQCSDAAGAGFTATGDNARSMLPTLSRVVASGLRTLIWAGDADWICNYLGGFDVVQQVDFPGAAAFRAAPLQPYTVAGSNGTEAGLYKTVDNLSWIQVYGAGHEVPYYAPQLALQAFRQTMSGHAVSAT